MKTPHVVLKNFFSLTAAEIITRVGGVILTIYIARVLGPSNLGILAFAQAFIAYFIVLSDFNLHTIGVREIAKHKKKTSTVGTAVLATRFILSILTVALVTALLFFLNISSLSKILIFLFSVAIVPTSLNPSFIFSAHQRMEFEGFLKAFYQLFYFLLGLIFIVLLKDLRVLPVTNFISGLATLLIAFPLVFKFIGFRFQRVYPSLIFNLFRVAFPLGIASLMIQVYYFADTIILQFIKGEQIVGFYNAAYKLMLVIVGFGFFFHSAVFPIMAETIDKKDSTKIKRLTETTFRIVTLFGFPVAVGGTILGSKIISLAYGLSQYLPSVLPFQILVWNTLIIWVNMIFGNLLIASRKQGDYLKVVTVGAVSNVVLNIFLIPRFSMIGAAVTTLLSEFFVLAAGLAFTYSHFPFVRMNYAARMWKPLLASLGMGLLLSKLLFVNVFLLIACGVVIYLALSLILKTLTVKDIKIALSLAGVGRKS